MILDDRHFCEQLGKETYRTLSDTWNARVAAERFISLSELLIKGEQIDFKEGPCSRAGIVSQKYNY